MKYLIKTSIVVAVVLFVLYFIAHAERRNGCYATAQDTYSQANYQLMSDTTLTENQVDNKMKAVVDSYNIQISECKNK